MLRRLKFGYHIGELLDMAYMEFTKIAGSALTALLLVFGGRTLINIVHEEEAGEAAAHVGYKLPMAAIAATGGGAAAEKPFDAKKVVSLISKASVEAGQATFKKCAACHSPEKGGPNAVGPGLYGVVGRDVGTKDGFTYSASFKGKGGKWDLEGIANYVHDPKGFIPGNKMAFVGLPDDQELAEVLAYVRTLSDSPAPLPN